jgi:adenylosuccinate lyase
VREAAMKAFEQDKPFKETLLDNPEIAKRLTSAEVDEITNPENYIGTAVEQVNEVLRKEGYIADKV